MDILINLAALGAAALVVFILIMKTGFAKINPLMTLLLVALIGLSTINGFKLSGRYKGEGDSQQGIEELTGRIAFSKDKPNTVILFLDRALAGAVPVALEEFPELKDEYDGFTWYPDTLSFGVNTITTLPAMLGGYEYSPQSMITRRDLSLKDKAKEGLMVLPELFLQKNSSVYVSIPLHKGFDLQAEDLDTLLKKDVITEDLKGLYAKKWLSENGIPSDFGQFLKRDVSFFLFSLFRMSPLYFREDLYDKGSWHSLNKKDPDFVRFSNLHNALSFLEEWGVLDYLPELSYTGSEKATFFHYW